MAKERNLKTMYLAIIIILIILLFVGFYRVRYAYASETGLNKVYTINEIYDMYGIPEEIRVNPREYGYERILGVVDTLDYRLYFICFNNPFDFNKTYTVVEQVKYRFDETVRFIEYDTNNKRLNYNDEFNEFEYWIATEPLNETTYDENYLGRRIIYSSHDIYKDGTLFFSARKLNTRMAKIMANLSPELGKVMTEVVSLIPIGAGLVVSFLGFRKGLRLLLTMLRQA